MVAPYPLPRFNQSKSLCRTTRPEARSTHLGTIQRAAGRQASPRRAGHRPLNRTTKQRCGLPGFSLVPTRQRRECGLVDAALEVVARRSYLTSAGDQPAVTVASGVPDASTTSAEAGAGGFAVATGTSFFGRLLPEVPIGRRSAWTGLEANRGEENTPDVSESTEIVCGW
jgi:hypothetical protein